MSIDMKSWAKSLKSVGMVVGLGVLGGAACGPMPGYVPRPEREAANNAPARPPAPAPEEDAPAIRSNPPAERSVRRDAQVEDDPSELDDTTEASEPEQDETPADPPPRPPKPTRSSPPPNWDAPAPAKTQRAPAPAPRPEAPREEPAPEPTPSAMKTIRLDADTYYLIDPVRKLCFLRHKESMTALDCAKIPEASELLTTRPARPEPARPQPEPAREAPPAPASPNRKTPAKAAPTPDEMVRFEAAFTDIFCDRKTQDDTAPEDRIKERGLSTDRYEAIESWWAADENAWWTLTTRAAKGCK